MEKNNDSKYALKVDRGARSLISFIEGVCESLFKDNDAQKIVYSFDLFIHTLGNFIVKHSNVDEYGFEAIKENKEDIIKAINSWFDNFYKQYEANNDTRTNH